MHYCLTDGRCRDFMERMSSKKILILNIILSDMFGYVNMSNFLDLSFFRFNIPNLF